MDSSIKVTWVIDGAGMRMVATVGCEVGMLEIGDAGTTNDGDGARPTPPTCHVGGAGVWHWCGKCLVGNWCRCLDPRCFIPHG